MQCVVMRFCFATPVGMGRERKQSLELIGDILQVAQQHEADELGQDVEGWRARSIIKQC